MYWLLKSEPDEFSIQDLESKKQAPWDGVRNYQARNFIEQMTPGDRAFFYHSSCKNIGIAGEMEIVSTPYPDPLAINPKSAYFDKKSLNENKWLAIEVKHIQTYTQVLPLSKIKKIAETEPKMATFDLIKKGSRLSVMPVTSEQWRILSKLMS